MASSIPLQIAETIQTAHIQRSPSPRHDLAPATAAERKEPVQLEEVAAPEDHDDELDDEDDIPYSVIKPRRRSAQLPPLPDLRFEQSYLHSIANADTRLKVAWITIRDQVSPRADGRPPPCNLGDLWETHLGTYKSFLLTTHSFFMLPRS